jgi:flagellar hook-associated protein 2
MATISSAGIGSGLDVNNIVTQLVALEKQPLRALEIKEKTVTAQLSAFAQIQSQFQTLTDVATRISSTTGWSTRAGSSSNPAAASMTVAATAAATSFTLDIDALAKEQSNSSASVPIDTLVGAGTLTFRTGSWSGSFVPGVSTADVSVVATATDTISTLAAKINTANAGVVATVFRDGSGERLLLRSKDTGVASGFRVQASVDADANPTDNLGLSRFAYDPAAGAFGMATVGIPAQAAQDAQARINGLAVTSKNNTLADNIPGVTIQLSAVTTTSATMSIREDVTPGVKNVQDFVTAYNALNQTLADLTKYDPATKTSSLFQADSAVIGIQNILRSMAGSISTGSAYQRLSDVGVQRQLDGSLTLNTSKLSTAANNGTELQKLFTSKTSETGSNGFAVKFADLGKTVLGFGGSVANKAVALQNNLKRNTQEQTRVNERAAAFEARVRKQYSALDARMANLTALNAYVAQQVTTWNKNSS